MPGADVVVVLSATVLGGGSEVTGAGVVDVAVDVVVDVVVTTLVDDVVVDDLLAASWLFDPAQLPSVNTSTSKATN